MNKESIKKTLSKFWNAISSKFLNLIALPSIGALVVNDSSIQSLGLKNYPERSRQLNLNLENVKDAVLRLPPGIIEDGRVKNKKDFILSLKELHNQISPDPKKILNVILSIPANNVYVQSFNLPKLVQDNISQAVELNAKMVSPIPIDGSYWGWQKIGENLIQGGQIEVLSGFITKGIVDDYTDSLKQSCFGVAAVEFSTLSLVRSLKNAKVIDEKKPYLVVNVNSEGLEFILVKNGSLYFDYSHSWIYIQGEGRNISIELLKPILRDDIQKLINFYGLRSESGVKDIILITPSLQEEFSSMIKSSFPGVSLQIFSNNLINPLLGGAYRGLSPRVSDFEISLMNVGVAQTFIEEQMLNFAAIWRNTFISVSTFILFVFVLTNLFLQQTERDVSVLSNLGLKKAETDELLNLKAQVNNFNKEIDFVKLAKDKDKDFSGVVKAIKDDAGSRISINRISISDINTLSFVTGETDSNSLAVIFKNTVSKRVQFSDVELPLASLTTQPSGRVIFTLNFKIKSLDF